MEETRSVQVAFGWAGEGTTDTAERPRTEALAPLDSAAAARRLRSRRTGRKTEPGPRTGTKGRPATPAPAVASTGSPRADALPPDNELWDVHAAARFLKRSVSWVYHRAEDGTLPVKRLGGWGAPVYTGRASRVGRGGRRGPRGDRTGGARGSIAMGTRLPAQADAGGSSTRTRPASGARSDARRAPRPRRRRSCTGEGARVDRQRLGLAPRSLNPEGWTVADLMRWWLDTYSRHPRVHESNVGTVRRHILGVADRREAARARPAGRRRAAPPGEGGRALAGHHQPRPPVPGPRVQQGARRREVARRRTRPRRSTRAASPSRSSTSSRPRRCSRSSPRSAPDQRPVFAAAIFTGLRKGELCGLQKDDVDLARRLLVARRSYERPFPKSRQAARRADPGRVRAVPRVRARERPRDRGSSRDDDGEDADQDLAAGGRAAPRAEARGDRDRVHARLPPEDAAAHARSGPMTISAPARAVASSSGRRGTFGQIRFHDLRHTYASVLLMLGARARVGAEAARALATRRSPSGATATCSRTS